MEVSGENWPSYHSDLGVDYDINDLCVDEDGLVEHGELLSSSDSHDSFAETEKELKEKLIALSATIPGLKKNKMDNASILDKATKYVKQLQERVRELEKQVESPFCINKGTITCEVSSDDNDGTNYILSEVRARVLQNQVLVIIHCENQKGIMLKILSQLENIHLSVLNSSVLPFGKSRLDITIVTQMDDDYNMTVNELVQSLRLSISSQ